MSLKIGVIKGDGIGPEIVTEAMKVLDKAGEVYGFFYFGSFTGSECDIPSTGRRKKSDPYNYKRKDPA